MVVTVGLGGEYLVKEREKKKKKAVGLTLSRLTHASQERSKVRILHWSAGQTCYPRHAPGSRGILFVELPRLVLSSAVVPNQIRHVLVGCGRVSSDISKMPTILCISAICSDRRCSAAWTWSMGLVCWIGHA